MIFDPDFYDQELMTDSKPRRALTLCGLGESRDYGSVIYVGILEINARRPATVNMGPLIIITRAK